MAWCHQAWWHQANTWANVDLVLCHHMMSRGHNELNDQFTNSILKISHRIVLSRIPQGYIDDKSTLVHVMAWCHQICVSIWHMVSLGHNESCGAYYYHLIEDRTKLLQKKITIKKWLPYWGLNKMADIVLTIFSNSYSHLFIFLYWISNFIEVCH